MRIVPLVVAACFIIPVRTAFAPANSLMTTSAATAARPPAVGPSIDMFANIRASMKPITISFSTKIVPASAAAVARLTQDLIRIPSITPDDNGCQPVIRKRLEPLGFSCESLQYHDVTNLWCIKPSPQGNDAPTVAFLGHTDVVPVGEPDTWTLPPFGGQIHDNYVYGRGAIDMKGSIASFVIAVERFLPKHSALPYNLAVLLTSDEEGEAQWGTRAVLEELTRRGDNTKIDMAIIGEPSSLERVGDVVKVGRRGSLSGDLSILGIQGHVAYHHLARNPIHESLDALKELVDERWDDGTEDFPPTSFQISNIQSGTGALNVIPGFKKVHFNFRYSPAITDVELRERVHAILDKHGLQYELSWSETCPPFETAPGGELVEEAMAAVQEVMGYPSRPCTSGGTSDGRFVAAAFPHAQIVELGHINETIHKIDERVAVPDLERLSQMYERLLDRLRIVEEAKQQNGGGGEYPDHHVYVSPLP